MADEFKKEAQFKTYWHHRKPGFWFRKDRDRPDGIRDFPEIVRFNVEPGVTPSGKPPVRIFLGTEPSQYRAERVFIWAVKQVRDPARVYEIYIMKDLKGYDRRGWKTGFTNYRYGIPAMAGARGRAIYNDVDQVYLSDPAELFDMEMNGAGILGITGRETSVLLIDCEKMAKFWSIDEAKAGRKHRYFREITHGNSLWGQLPGEWNARDEEFEQGQSKCFHFTTLQTQPWQPFPDQLLYKPHPDGEVWFALERAADQAGYTPFTKEQPSRRFTEMLEQYRILHERGEQNLELEPQQTFSGKSLARHLADIGKLCGQHGASNLLDYGCGKALFYDRVPGEPDNSRLRRHAQLPGVTVTCYDPGYKPFSDPYEGPFDGVISTDVLEHIPEEDIGWVLDELFGAARTFVYVVAACYPARKTLPNGENAHCTLLSPEWWAGQLDAAARRKPDIHWTLCTIEKTKIGKRRRLQDGTGAQRQAA